MTFNNQPTTSSTRKKNIYKHTYITIIYNHDYDYYIVITNLMIDIHIHKLFIIYEGLSKIQKKKNKDKTNELRIC